MLLSNYNYDNCRLFSYVPLLVLYEKKKKKKPTCLATFNECEGKHAMT